MQGARLAAFAALAATAGDLLLLHVANAQRPALGLPAPPSGALAVGGLLGVVAIPLYALGYRAAARAMAPAAPRAARAVAILGGVAAALGAAIHGGTALAIRADLARGAPAGDPLAAVAGWGPWLVAPWLAASLCVLAASALLAARAPALGAARVANPALLTVALAALGAAAGELGRAFLLPAAPNLAHLAFFALCARGRGRR